MRIAILITICAAFATTTSAMPEPPSDGPAALVANINRTIDDSEGSAPYHFTTAGRYVYFIANDGEHRAGLWRTDGTRGGTILLADFTGADGSTPWVGPPLPIGGDAVLLSVQGTVWRSDGTPAGTVVVHEGRAGELVMAGGRVYCIEDNQLWILDPASGATTRLSAFANDGYPVAPMRLYAAGDRLLFIGCTAETGCEPWRSDGTAAGTGLVREIAPGPADGMRPYRDDPGTAVIDGVLYFVGDDGETGAELWRSDGTAAGTRRVRDIRRGPDSGLLIPYGQHDGFLPLFTVHGRTLLFIAWDGRRGFELWRSDGSHDGTRLVADLLPGEGGLFDCAASVYECEPHPRDRLTAVAHDTAYFVVRRPPVEEYGRALTQLWRSDGTAAGTRLVEEGVDTAIAAFADRLFFTRRTSTGYELWMRAAADGPSAVVADLQGGALLTHASDLGLVLAAWRGEPWWSDGTAAGTFLLRDIRGDDASSYPVPLGAVGDVLLLGADDGVSGSELWRSDGSADGTTLVADIAPGPAGSRPWRGLGFDDGVLFAADDGVHGRELWYSDGTSAGTRLVRDIQGGAGGALNEAWWGDALGAVADGRLYFAADDGVHGVELWRSDGTAGGTELVADLSPGPASTIIWAHGTWDDRAVFAATAGQATLLWRTDGAATAPFARLPDDAAGLRFLGDDFYFTSWDAGGSGLWRVGGDGVPVPVESPAPYTLVDAGGALLGIHPDWNLWRLGYGSLEVYGDVVGLRAFDRRTVFLTGRYWQGRGLGTSGGTAETTGLLQVLEPPEEGPSGYDCEQPFFTRAGERVFFAAQAGDIGCELWALPLEALSEVCVEDCPPPPTPTPTEPPRTRSPTPSCVGADCTQVVGDEVAAQRGERVDVAFTLRAAGPPIAGLQVDITFGTQVAVAAGPGGGPDCRVDPAIGKSGTAFAFQPPGCRPERDCRAVRALVLAFDNLDPIADGAVLFTCAVRIAPRAALDRHALRLTNLDGSTDQGEAVAVGGVDAGVTVLGAGTAGTRTTGGDGCQVGPGGSGWQWVGLLVLLLTPARRRG